MLEPKKPKQEDQPAAAQKEAGEEDTYETVMGVFRYQKHESIEPLQLGNGFCFP